jgi:hypothetical protein
LLLKPGGPRKVAKAPKPKPKSAPLLEQKSATLPPLQLQLELLAA